MYSQLDIGISNKKNLNDETYEYIYNTSNYVCINLKQNMMDSNMDLYKMNLMNKLCKENITTQKTDYKIHININKYTGNEIRFLKNTNDIKYDINIIVNKINDTEYKLIGVEYNNNKYYVYNKKKSVDDYQTLCDDVVDKSTISEIIKESFEYYFKFRCNYEFKYNNLLLLDSFDKYYNKKYINYNSENTLDYMALYQSMMLKFEIYDTVKNETKSCTFLPINKKSCSNLYNIYQIVFNVLEPNNNLKTFTNPKNELYFSDNYKIVTTCFTLKIRLFVSKFNNYNTLYYRKCTENNNYNIHFMLDNNTKKIIGIKFHDTKYYIWKNNGDLNTYEIYNENENYHELILNTFKDALIFLFKIY